jgi:branched-subunit amino acid transport protein
MAEIWVTILLAGVLTFLIRFSFIFLMGRWQLPQWVGRALRFVPPAVLSAIIFPEVLYQNGAFYLAAGNLRIWAALLAALVAWRTRNIFLTILAGMAGLYLLNWMVQ